MLLVTQTDQAVRATLAAELAEVEDCFMAELTSDLGCVNTLVSHLERYRGKMLRPMLVLISGMASSVIQEDSGEQAEVGELTNAHRTVAAVVEMVHMATLVHDDILDEAEVRRRGDTINHLSGNEVAVMLGDYLISHAYHLCSSLGDQTISRMLAETTNTVCEGELLQLANRHNWELDESTYLEMIRRKTASLCGACCRLGVMLSEAPRQIAEALYRYGEMLGIAFQIIDDVLDMTGDPDTVGKTLGSDLEKGKPTLPLIQHLAAAQPKERKCLLTLLTTAPETKTRLRPDQVAHVRQRMLKGNSIAYASEQAARLVQRAKSSLGHLAESPAKTLLFDMADAVLTRKF